MCVAVVLGIGLLALALAWPFTKQALIDVLQERSVRSVRYGSFSNYLFPTRMCRGPASAFSIESTRTSLPLITISRLEVRGSYWGMIIASQTPL